MGEVKELNIKNQIYHYLDDMIDIRNFHSNLLKIDKKPYKDVDIWYIGYITIKNFGDCENIHSVNPLYLKIHSATGHTEEQYGEKYLIIDSTEEYEEVFSGIKSKIETINDGEEMFYEKNYGIIRVNTENDLLLNIPLNFQR